MQNTKWIMLQMQEFFGRLSAGYEIRFSKKENKIITILLNLGDKRRSLFFFNVVPIKIFAYKTSQRMILALGVLSCGYPIPQVIILALQIRTQTISKALACFEAFLVSSLMSAHSTQHFSDLLR